MKIYTGKGDAGTTGIHGGKRVDKDDIRIIANGSLDELNAVVGVVRAYLPSEHEWQPLLFRIQTLMMTVMSQVATPSADRSRNPNRLPEDVVGWCEKHIDAFTMKLEDTGYFVLPGGNLVSSHLQWARTVVRRAETQLWTLHRKDAVPAEILCFINRLSDLFFTMARLEMQREGGMEEKWKPFAYKARKP